MSNNANSNFRDYVYPLQAGVPETITVRGDYWQLVEAPGGPVSIDFEQGVKIKRKAGSGGPARYERVTLVSAVSQTVRISLGNTDGRLPYDRTTLDGQAISVAVIPSANATSTPTDVEIPPGGQVPLVTANPDRLELRVEIPPDAYGLIRIGDATCSASIGGRFYPGSVEFLAGQQAFWAFNPQPEPVTVSILELLKV